MMRSLLRLASILTIEEIENMRNEFTAMIERDGDWFIAYWGSVHETEKIAR